MPIITPFQSSFQSGEFSPKLHGRLDMDQYYSASQELLNFAALPYGPILKRTGSRLINDMSAYFPDLSLLECRLAKFIYRVDQSAVILFLPEKAYFFTDLGPIVNDDDTLYNIDTPWLAEDLINLRFAQTGDVLWVVCGMHPPSTISRYGWHDWRFEVPLFTEAPDDWVEGNYPRQVCFFEQRLCLASSVTSPQTIWCSRIASYTDMTTKTVIGTETEVMDSDSIWYTLSADDTNGIAWLLPLEILAVGTQGGEYKATASSLNEAITPKNFKITRQSNYGSNWSAAAAMDNGCVFIQRDGKRVRLFQYQVMSDNWDSMNITATADHILGTGAIKVEVMTSLDNYTIALTKEGYLAVFSYDKESKVKAWFRIVLADNARILDFTIIPGVGAEDSSDQIWMMVKRDHQVFMECLAPAFGELDDEVFMDAFLEYRGEETNIVRNLEHFINETVDVMVDGWYYGTAIVATDGTITLTSSGTWIAVGKSYIARMVTMNINNNQELTMARQKRMIKADLFLHKTLGLRVGTVPSDIQTYEGRATDIVYLGPTEHMNAAPTPFTGNKDVLLSSDTSTDVAFVFESYQPYPCMLRDIKYTIDVR